MQALFILKIPDEMKETYIQNVMKYIDLLEFWTANQSITILNTEYRMCYQLQGLL